MRSRCSRTVVPELGKPVPGQRRIGHDRRRPGRRPWRQDMQRRAVFGSGSLGAREVVAVGLVDRDHVGELDQALLEALQLVAGARQHQHQEKIGHVGDHGLRLAGADGLDQHDVVAGGFAESASIRGSSQRPRRACRTTGEGRTKALGSQASRAMRVLSARIEPPLRAEDGSTASTATLMALRR